MSRLTIELAPQREQDALNLRRWDEVLADPHLARIEGRVETDRHGQIIMSPPPSARHGSLQARIVRCLWELMPAGEVLTECPISTADGVRAADVAWASEQIMRALGNRSCFPRSPEICVEVLSPSNTPKEIAEKKALYFDAGAREVWVCESSGQMSFFTAPTAIARRTSPFCAQFPEKIPLP